MLVDYVGTYVFFKTRSVFFFPIPFTHSAPLRLLWRSSRPTMFWPVVQPFLFLNSDRGLGHHLFQSASLGFSAVLA